jgi:MFS family permease
VNAGITLGLIPWGFAADRFGEARAIAVGLAGASGALALAAAADTIGLLLPALVATGLCTACVIPSSGRALMYWFHRDRRGLAVAIRQSGTSLGGVLAALILPAVVAFGGLRDAFVVLAIPCLISGAAGAYWLATPRDEIDEEPEPARPRPFRDSRLWRLGVSGFLLFAAQAATVSYTVLFLHRHRGLSTGSSAAVLAGIQLGGATLRIAAGRWSDRHGRRIAPLRTIGAATSVALLALALTTTAPLALTTTVLLVAGSLSMGSTGLLFAAAAELAGRKRSGQALGLQQAILGLAATASPIVFGVLVATSSWGLAFGLLALCPLAAMLSLRGPISSF